MIRRLLLSLLLATVAAGNALAHTRSQSYSQWMVADQTLEGTVTLLARDVTRLPEAGRSADLIHIAVEQVKRDISVDDTAGACKMSGAAPLVAEAGYIRLSVSFTCDTAPHYLTITLLQQVAASHLHIARVVWPKRQIEQEFLYRTGQPRHTISPAGDAREAGSFLSWLRLGVDHILSGYDHLAFLLALMLGVAGWRQVVLVITGFTVGHSLTLSLAAVGWVVADSIAVEALIGFTIALVAAENLDPDQTLARPLAVVTVPGLLLLLTLSDLPAMLLLGLAVFTGCYLLLGQQLGQQLGPGTVRLRPALTILFGLIHGFGFAGALSEMGIPDGRLITALLGFNLGVELGQLALVFVAALLAVLVLRRLSGAGKRRGAAVLSAALLALGLFWFVSRAFA